jgi:hypothetical protein
MIQRAEQQKAKDGAARLIQCTIRVGNIESDGAFRKQGYIAVNRFYNSRTKQLRRRPLAEGARLYPMTAGITLACFEPRTSSLKFSTSSQRFLQRRERHPN